MADAPDSIPLAELRDDALNVRTLASGKKVVIVRRGADVKVFNETCPHMGADLAEARYCAAEGTLHCKWHGYVFSAEDGHFMKNPNEQFMALLRAPSEHFKPDKTPRYRLAVVPSTVEGGRVIIGRTGGGDA